MGILAYLEKADRWLVDKIGVVRSRRLGRLLVGIIPSIGCAAMVTHCATLLMGYDLHISAFLFKYSLLWWMLMTILSIAFEFCWVHRAFCAYNYIIGVLIEHQRLHGFGMLLTPFRWFFLLLGIWLIYAFFRRNCWRDFFEHAKVHR